MKKVLIICNGNSCRSIMAEALINKYFNDIKAFSAGIKPIGKVNPNAKKVLKENGCWDEKYHSKCLNEILDIDFDLVVTVCDQAKQSCPSFSLSVKKIHIGFEDPDKKTYDKFEEIYNNIKKELLPKVQEALV